MLGFKAESVVLFKAATTRLSIQKVTRVELDSGLGRENLHFSAGLRAEYRCSKTQLTRLGIQNKIMVVSSRVATDLIYSRANLGRFSKVQWCAFDRLDFSRRG